MKRDLSLLQNKRFDVLVVGGGIYGATLAWEAAARGLSCAVIDQEDFGSKTSANSLKIVHGGLRYLQSLDIIRMRESIRERRTLLKIAPELVRPLRCVMPTYQGEALKSKAVLKMALQWNDWIGFDRNKGLAPEQSLPAGEILSREKTLSLCPGLRPEGLTGAIVWHDALMKDSGQLVMAFMASAVHRGAVAANYVSMKDFLWEGITIKGVLAQDAFTDRPFPIEARLVINASGPWINKTLLPLGQPFSKRIPFTKAMNLVFKRPVLPGSEALAVYRPGGQVFFLVPWQGVTMAGTVHAPWQKQDLGQPLFSPQEIEDFLKELNKAYPGLNASPQDVSQVLSGLLPGEEGPSASGPITLWKRYRIVDHQTENHISGLISIVGVKFTTARHVAEKTIDLAFEKLQRPWVASPTSQTLLEMTPEMQAHEEKIVVSLS